MKKTIIALMALAGIAAAESLTLTTGITYNGKVYDGYTSDSNGQGSMAYTVEAGDSEISCTFDAWPGETNNTITFTVSIKDLYCSGDIAETDIITLNSFAYRVHPDGWSQDGGNSDNPGHTRTFTLKVDGTQVQSIALDGNQFDDAADTVVFSGLNSTITLNSTLEVTLSGSALSLGVATITTPDAVWSGVTTVDTNQVTGGAPLVSLGITTTIPEPATATLSLLALAGLAARRRRK